MVLLAPMRRNFLIENLVFVLGLLAAFLSAACEAAAMLVMDIEVVTVFVVLVVASAVRFSSEAERLLGLRGFGSGVIG